MLALARISVLEQRGAIEIRQAVRVAREVRRHPVEKYADAGLVQDVDEDPEVVGRPEASGRRVIADGLVAPRRIEWVLADRQQLDVGVAHHLAVLGQLPRQLAIRQEAASLGRALP